MATFYQPGSKQGPIRSRITFDKFEVDLRSGELRKDGRKVRLQAQPFQLLALLVGSAGEVVTREVVCQALWPADTFVDFDHGLAVAVNKLREALGDSAEKPKFIETLPKRGYRFIGTVRPEPPAILPNAEGQKLEVVASTGTARKQNLWLAVAAAVVLAASATLVMWRKPKQVTVEGPLTAERFTAYPGLETAPAISPDGTRIAFAWDNDSTNKTGKPGYDLYVKAMGSETLVKLTNHPADWISSAWSPDGTQIAFHRLANDGTGIYVVPAMGGPERKLLTTHAPYNLVAPLSWSPDGRWLAFADRKEGIAGDRMYLLNLETLEVRPFPSDPGCIHEGSLTFSHSGKQLAMLCVHNLSSIEYRVTDLEGKNRRSLATRAEFPLGLIWRGDDQAVIVAMQTGKGSTFRELKMDGSTDELDIPGGSWPTISSDGKMVAYSAYDSRINIWKRDLQHPEAEAEKLLTSSRMQNAARYSPDGKHLAFDSDRTGVWSIWLSDADGNNLVQMTKERPAGFPRWSPDSQEIAFEMADGDGMERVYVANIADRVPHKLACELRASSMPTWSTDGRWIYVGAFEGTGHQIYRCPAQGGRGELVASGMEYQEAFPSEDGKTLYIAWNAGTNQLDLLRLDPKEALPQKMPGSPAVANNSQMEVVANGIYFTPEDKPRSVWFYEFATQKSHEVFQAEKVLGDGISVSPDGRYLLYSQEDEIGADVMVARGFR